MFPKYRKLNQSIADIDSLPRASRCVTRESRGFESLYWFIYLMRK
ncbi:hypothetical protein SAMN06265379_11091 [Saccharicrinis carchari]|uniref:Uncharacterized protein n=1 Tax=Saccharicrinis carchari TaxID=1168039 RepID=A0A521ESJ9_SACCC|nr:hypothetical protein SAMN06265379_11091 [Saccharicrinis carchari]